MEIKEARFAPGSEGLLTPLLPFLQDKSVSELLINKPYEVFVEKNGEMIRHEIKALSNIHLKRLFLFIANENGQSLDDKSPLLSGNLFDGSRVQLVIPPSSKHYALSIRRKSIKRLTLDDYKQTGFYNAAIPFHDFMNDGQLLLSDDKALNALYQQQRWAQFIELAVSSKKNIVISGETSSGKTTFLNACVNHIPEDERIITLEDTFEIEAPHINQVSLKAPKKLENEQATVTMQDLVQCSLRLRPDRIIMGEMRGAEILDFVSACSTGHDGSISTIHAPNPRVALMRMVQMYKFNNVSMSDDEIRHVLNEVIDIILQVEPTAQGRRLKYVHYKNAHLFQGN